MVNKATALVFGKDGEVQFIRLTVEDIKTIVWHNSLEGLYLGDNALAYMDEDAKLKDLPVNKVATDFVSRYRLGFEEFDNIRGPMVVVGLINPYTGEKDGDHHDVPDLMVTMANMLATRFIKVEDDK